MKLYKFIVRLNVCELGFFKFEHVFSSTFLNSYSRMNDECLQRMHIHMVKMNLESKVMINKNTNHLLIEYRLT